MEKKTRSLQIIYGLILVVSVVFAVLSETEILPVDYIGNEPHTLYWLNLYAIFVAFGGMFLCLRMFVFKKVRKALMCSDECVAYTAYHRYVLFRLFIIALALWSNTVLYFSTSYSSTPQYCILVTLVSCAFCWPSVSTFRGLRKDDKKEEKLKQN